MLVKEQTMKRWVVFGVALAAMMGVSALALQQRPGLLLTTWASKAQADSPTTAVLIELGTQDSQPRDWSGHATIRGAKIVKRIGYRFPTGDQLLQPAPREASSHRCLKAS